MNLQNFKFETGADGVALLTWDMPGRSMNVITESVMDELAQVIDAVEKRRGDQGLRHHLRQERLFRRRGPLHAATERRAIREGAEGRRARKRQ